MRTMLLSTRNPKGSCAVNRQESCDSLLCCVSACLSQCQCWPPRWAMEFAFSLSWKKNYLKKWNRKRTAAYLKRKTSQYTFEKTDRFLWLISFVNISSRQAKMSKGIVRHFVKYTYSLSCWEWDKKIDITFISTGWTLKLQPAVRFLGRPTSLQTQTIEICYC